MTIHQALSGVTALGFDTAPLIYFVEQNATYVDRVREIIRRVDAGMPRRAVPLSR